MSSTSRIFAVGMAACIALSVGIVTARQRTAPPNAERAIAPEPAQTREGITQNQFFSAPGGDWITILSSVAVAAFTGALVLVGWRQWSAIKEQNKHIVGQ